MPRKRNSRRRGLVPLKFNAEVALGTLGADVATSVATVAALEQDFDIVSTDLTCSIANHTAGEGPLDFGLQQHDYTLAEVVEALDASPRSQYGTEYERSLRKVRHYGRFSGEGTDETVNDGEPIRKKMFLRAFAGQNDEAARVYIVNRSGGGLTTGTILEIQGTHWGRWK